MKLFSKIVLFTFIYICSIYYVYGQTYKNKDSIPIKYYSHLYLSGKINNIEGLFLFDTGADNLYFDSIFYNKNLNYPTIGKGLLPGVGSTPQEVKVILDDVNVVFNDYLYTTTMVPVMSLKTLVGDQADGIIGYEFFNEKVIEINYINEYMRVFENIESIDTKDYTKIQLKRVKDRLLIPLTVNVNDSISINNEFLLDLGSGSNISFTSYISDKYNLDRHITEKVNYYTKYGGAGGDSQSYVFITKSVIIGGYEIEYPVSDYSLDKAGALASGYYAGLVGNEIFQKFDLILDYRNNVLYIKPNSNFSEETGVPRLGFGYTYRAETLGGLIVSGFYKGSSAEKSGLQVDDMIIEINDIPVKSLNQDQINDIWRSEKIKLKVERLSDTLIFEINPKPLLVK